MKSFQERANELIQQGNSAKTQGRVHEAIAAYREAIDLVPAYGTLNLVIGDMLYEDGQKSAAAAAYQAVVDYDPDHDQAWASLGQCQLLLEEEDQAKTSFDAALRANPANVEANYYGAMLDARDGETKQAAEKLFAALSQRPNWEEQARNEELFAPLFEQSRKLANLNREKRWWEIWK